MAMLFVQRDSLVLLAPTISLINVGQFRGHSCFTICREENIKVTHLGKVVINMHDNKLEKNTTVNYHDDCKVEGGTYQYKDDVQLRNKDLLLLSGE